jgi:uncharacterized cofD-like protein
MNKTFSKIVAVGGGTGTSKVLAGLKSYDLDLTGIISTMDSGGSTGILRESFSIPAVGDLRRALGSLASDDPLTSKLAKFLEYRFPKNSELNGHSLGNLLILSALLKNQKNLSLAIEDVSALLKIKGRVIPVATSPSSLYAKLTNGEVLENESSIDTRKSGLESSISEVWINPQINANPEALAAINQADTIIIGPGDLYTSIIPNFLVKDISEAISNSKSKIVYIANISNKIEETANYRLSDFLKVIIKYIGNSIVFDGVIVNQSSDVIEFPIEYDFETCQRLTKQIYTSNIKSENNNNTHDSKKLGEILYKILN